MHDEELQEHGMLAPGSGKYFIMIVFDFEPKKDLGHLYPQYYKISSSDFARDFLFAFLGMKMMP